jgi:hypothetical protein
MECNILSLYCISAVILFHNYYVLFLSISIILVAKLDKCAENKNISVTAWRSGSTLLLIFKKDFSPFASPPPLELGT